MKNLLALIEDVRNEHRLRPHFHDYDTALPYCALELAGEAGEAVDVVKKIMRQGCVNDMTSEQAYELRLELGDVLWALVSICEMACIDLDTVAKLNQEKLAARRAGK